MLRLTNEYIVPPPDMGAKSGIAPFSFSNCVRGWKVHGSSGGSVRLTTPVSLIPVPFRDVIVCLKSVGVARPLGTENAKVTPGDWPVVEKCQGLPSPLGLG